MSERSGFKLLDWRPLRKNTLRGFAKVELPSGMVIADVVVHVGGDSAWASPPARPMLDRDNVAMKDDKGKIRYAAVIEFNAKERRDAFSHAVIEAVRVAHPDAIL